MPLNKEIDFIYHIDAIEMVKYHDIINYQQILKIFGCLGSLRVTLD